MEKNPTFTRTVINIAPGCGTPHASTPGFTASPKSLKYGFYRRPILPKTKFSVKPCVFTRMLHLF